MLFAVTRVPGPAWDHLRGMREQDRWPEHAAFMDALEDDGFVVLGGPLGHGATILLVINADSDDAIRARLAADPWTSMGLLQIDTIERWQILLRNVHRLGEGP